MSATVSTLHAEAAEPDQERWPAYQAVLLIAGLSGGLWWGLARAVGWVLS